MAQKTSVQETAAPNPLMPTRPRKPLGIIWDTAQKTAPEQEFAAQKINQGAMAEKIS